MFFWWQLLLISGKRENTIECGFPVWGYQVVRAVIGAPKWVSKFEGVNPVHSSGNSLGRKLRWFDGFLAEKHLRLLHASSYQTPSATCELSYCCSQETKHGSEGPEEHVPGPCISLLTLSPVFFSPSYTFILLSVVLITPSPPSLHSIPRQTVAGNSYLILLPLGAYVSRPAMIPESSAQIPSLAPHCPLLEPGTQGPAFLPVTYPNIFPPRWFYSKSPPLDLLAIVEGPCQGLS